MPDTKNIPIRYGKYINHEMEEEKVIFIGAEKAIYGADGRRLDEKLIDMEDSLSDAFSTEKDYAAGDYCVYANRVFKFTNAKAAGAWDGAAVIPVSLAQEIRANAQDIAAINGSLYTNVGLLIPNGSDLNGYKEPGKYHCDNTADASTLANCPIAYGFSMYVEPLGFGDWICQTIKRASENEIYYRMYNPMISNWLSWKQDALKSDLGSYFKNNDLSSYTDDCNACTRIISFINASTLNTPYKQIGTGQNISSEGLLISIKPFVSGVYNCQYVFAVGEIQGKRIYSRYKRSDSAWTTWYGIV